MNNIHEKEICPYCDEKDIKYANFSEGYRRHCGYRICSYVDKSTYKDENGLTANEKSAKGISISQRKIEDNGKTRAQNSGLKSSNKKRNTFIDGRNLLTISAERAARTKENTILSNGLNISQSAALKAARTMDIKLMNGKTIKQQRIEDMIATKSKIGEDGLDGFERCFLHGAGKNSSIKYYNSNLYYQGTYEKNFLDFMTVNNKIDDIKRGERFNYFYKGHERQYRTDFLYKNNIIFEIKSSWTYGKYDEQLRTKNHIKFESVIDNGFKLFVILDKNNFIEVTKNNINMNLYNEKLEQIEKLIDIIE